MKNSVPRSRKLLTARNNCGRVNVTKLLKEVAEREGCAVEEIDWPQVLSTTTDPSDIGTANLCGSSKKILYN